MKKLHQRNLSYRIWGFIKGPFLSYPTFLLMKGQTWPKLVSKYIMVWTNEKSDLAVLATRTDLVAKNSLGHHGFSHHTCKYIQLNMNTAPPTTSILLLLLLLLPPPLLLF